MVVKQQPSMEEELLYEVASPYHPKALPYYIYLQLFYTEEGYQETYPPRRFYNYGQVT